MYSQLQELFGSYTLVFICYWLNVQISFISYTGVKRAVQHFVYYAYLLFFISTVSLS